jgi:GT2 family glycosyltransferase
MVAPGRHAPTDVVKALQMSVSGERSTARQTTGAAYRAEQALGHYTACLGALDPLIDVSIVIVNWNTRELLRACLASIVQNVERVRTEILVVDNGSRDGSAEMVHHDFPNVRLLANASNIGFAAANNLGLRQAHGRHLLLLNSDTLMLPGAIEEMVCYMDAHKRVGALGPRLRTRDGSLQLSTRDFPRLDHDAMMMLEVKHWPLVGDLARWYARRTYGGHYQHTHEVDWVQGSCLMLRREAVEEVGVLDESFFFDYEEPDLCYRLRQHNWPTVFLASTEIVHLGGQSRARVAAASVIWHYKSMLRFYRKHASHRRYLIVRTGVAVGAAGHVIWQLVWRQRSAQGRAILSAYARVLAYALTHQS